MKCPSCHEDLKAMRYLGVLVDMCEVCDGLWVTYEHLETIKKTERVFDEREVVKVRLLKEWKVIEGSEHASPFLCPVCELRLARTRYKEIPSLILDKCRKGCGLWLDKDGLQKIQILEKHGG